MVLETMNGFHNGNENCLRIFIYLGNFFGFHFMRSINNKIQDAKIKKQNKAWISKTVDGFGIYFEFHLWNS